MKQAELLWMKNGFFPALVKPNFPIQLRRDFANINRVIITILIVTKYLFNFFFQYPVSRDDVSHSKVTNFIYAAFVQIVDTNTIKL